MIPLRTSGDSFSWEKTKMTPMPIWSLKWFNFIFLVPYLHTRNSHKNSFPLNSQYIFTVSIF